MKTNIDKGCTQLHAVDNHLSSRAGRYHASHTAEALHQFKQTFFINLEVHGVLYSKRSGMSDNDFDYDDDQDTCIVIRISVNMHGKIHLQHILLYIRLDIIARLSYRPSILLQEYE